MDPVELNINNDFVANRCRFFREHTMTSFPSAYGGNSPSHSSRKVCFLFLCQPKTEKSDEQCTTKLDIVISIKSNEKIEIASEKN